MRREISCKLDGTNVVQTTSVFDDDGTLLERRSIVLGDRETVLEQVSRMYEEAKRDLDGISSPDPKEPVPAAVGRPGAKEVLFWMDGSNLYRCEVERDSAGRVRTCRSTLEGKRNQRLEAAAQREAELRMLKEKIEEAKP
jgi:hypothetical protein